MKLHEILNVRTVSREGQGGAKVYDLDLQSLSRMSPSDIERAIARPSLRCSSRQPEHPPRKLLRWRPKNT